MPVLDDGFVPNFPLAKAEQHVNFPVLHREIMEGRALVERHALPAARSLAVAVALVELLPVRSDLESRFEVALERIARIGYREARAEITSLRATPIRPVRAALAIPPEPAMPLKDMQALRAKIRRRSHIAAKAVADAVSQASNKPGLSQDERLAVLLDAARRATHNVSIELVGSSLNEGRTVGALSMSPPPEFAMRSEQLDKTTCDPCSNIHGTIVQVDTEDYYATLPPSYCLGGGRCRGVMVFGDGPVDLRQPDSLAA